MKLYFKGNTEGLEKGIEIFGRELGFEIAGDGIPVIVEQRPGNIEVVLDNGKAAIRYEKKIHFFRALGVFIEESGKAESFNVCEEPQFSMNGAMFDVSRNAVMTVGTIKRMVEKMALMGLDIIMLYTEDTYTIDEQPYFGYMRGRYTHEELKECDDYADIFGIEMIPCIQTLAHLRTFLQWDAVGGLRDNTDILLAGSEKTYELIENMIKSVSAPLRSKRIHIGMDEAHDLGLGNYMRINGIRNRFEIMDEHLRRVLGILEKYGLKPMIWSDMYFRLGSKTGGYYDLDADIPEEVVKNMPENVQLVYWDYYNSEGGFYDKFIEKHKEFGSVPVFAGGIWTWSGFGTNYGRTFTTTNSALNSCKKQGVTEVFATIWMNNNSIINFFSSLLGLQLYAEHGYARELDTDKLKRRFEFCTGASFEAFMDLKYLDETPGVKPDNLESANPSRFLLWNDVLQGLLDKHVKGFDLENHYAKYEKVYEKYEAENGEWGFVFKIPHKLCTVLKIKAGMGVRLKAYYDNKDMDGLEKTLREQMPELKKAVEELWQEHRKQWYDFNKAFGWEVLDLCYGGLLSRIDTARWRVQDYIDGRVDRLEEFEEERLYFDGRERPEGTEIGGSYRYYRTVSANVTWH